jgi:xylulokinase
MGERSPTYDSAAKGVLFGLTLAHGRDDITRAVLEGCAFQLRRIAERFDPTDLEEMVVAGGGAKGRPWVRIICDVLGIPLLVPRVLEAGALGAAILAGVGVGVYPDVDSAARKVVQIVRRVEPNRAHHERYERIYALFVDLERSVVPLYKRLPLKSWE